MNEPGKKAKLREAQQRHQSKLFGDQAQKPSSQAAGTQAQQRGQDLSRAAQAKQQRLSGEEARKLEELKHRNARARAQQAPPPPPRQDIPEPQQAPAPDQPAPTPPPTPSQPTPPPAPAAGRPNTPSPGGTRRQPPSPQELDKLLRQMADRARQRRAPGAAGTSPPPRPARPGMPGRPEMGMDAAPQVEAPPPPPDLIEKEKRTAEQSAEILKELQAREVTARQDIAPIPQSDQQRAKEEAVEARVPIKTEANAIDSGPLHEAIAQLQIAMRAQDPVGQVGGVNQVQRTMPHHPLYDPNVAQQDQQRQITDETQSPAPTSPPEQPQTPPPPASDPKPPESPSPPQPNQPGGQS